MTARGAARAAAELRAEAHAVWDARAIVALLMWDQQTGMPPAAAPGRAHLFAHAERALQERLRSDSLGRALDAVEDGGGGEDPDAEALARVLRHEREKNLRVPFELREQLAEAASLAQRAWARARERGSFDDFAAPLARNVELRRRYADCFDGLDDPYDAHLDDFDPGARTRAVAPVLDALRDRLLPLAAAVRDREPEPPLRGPFPVADQRAFVAELLADLGLDRSRARLVDSAHPLTVAIGIDDVGVTARYSEDDLDGVFLALHELGHASYEQGFGRELARTPLAQGASASMHEAQARLFENLVGRGAAFWRFAYPRLQAAFPALADVGLDRFTAVVNGVRNSPIRLRADELTYCLHIVLRFELERELLSGALRPADLPAAWADRTEAYLGLRVEDDAAGVLQDVQWALSAFGYFPTYALGNVVAVQLWRAIERSAPGLDAELARGDPCSVRAWLSEHVWRHGRRHPAGELLARAVGGGIDVEPYVAYLEAKFAPAAVTRPAA